MLQYTEKMLCFMLAVDRTLKALRLISVSEWRQQPKAFSHWCFVAAAEMQTRVLFGFDPVTTFNVHRNKTTDIMTKNNIRYVPTKPNRRPHFKSQLWISGDISRRVYYDQNLLFITGSLGYFHLWLWRQNLTFFETHGDVSNQFCHHKNGWKGWKYAWLPSTSIRDRQQKQVFEAKLWFWGGRDRWRHSDTQLVPPNVGFAQSFNGSMKNPRPPLDLLYHGWRIKSLLPNVSVNFFTFHLKFIRVLLGTRVKFTSRCS